MGLIDVFGAEGRVELPFSEFRRLAHIEAEVHYLKNAINAQIPRETINQFLYGTDSELEEYKKTGLTPEKILEMDKLYLEKCLEVSKLQEELDVLKKDEPEEE